MPQEITVAMIDTKFLDLKTFPVKQQEIQLKIDGDTDPNTLQRLRDQIVPSVQHHKQVINEFIAKTAVAVSKAKTKEDAEKLAKQGQDGLEKLLRSAVPKVQAAAEKFFKTDNATKQLYSTGKIQFRTILAWVPVTLILNKLLFADDDPVGWFMYIKSWVDFLKDAGTFLADCKAAYEQHYVTLKQLTDAIADVRKIKAPKKVEPAHLDTLKLKHKAYNARILGLQMQAKTAAKQLDDMLKSQAKMKDAPKPVMECVEQAVQNQIDMITQLNDTIDEGKKVLQSAEDHIKNAEKRVKTNTTSDWAGWLDKWGKIYEACSSLIDTGLAAKAGKLSEFAFNASKYFGGLKVDQFKG